jgi:putative phage-type endonuclease
MATIQTDYSPVVIVDTTEINKEEWLAYRRTGLGGSDVSAVLGVSPFTTGRDLYYDKLNIVSAIDDSDNWVQKEIGHLLEGLVAKIFHVKTGYRIYQIKKMFRHPQHAFMIADVDYFVELPDGSTAILEIKTTNYNNTGKWWDGNREIVPLHYELQGRHYMAVMNANRVYYCCLYGNNEDEVIIRHIDRDLDYESEMIALEEHFWVNHVQAQIPPPYTENGDLVLESIRRHHGFADISAPGNNAGCESCCEHSALS